MDERKIKLISLLTALVVSLITAAVAPRAASADQPEIWFPDIESTATSTVGNAVELARFAAAAVRTKDASVALPAVSSAADEDRQNRIVFLSLSNGSSPARVFIGAGKGVVKALEQAVSRTRTGLTGRNQPVWLKLDIVQEVYQREKADLYEYLSSEETPFGLALDRKTGTAFLPEELASAGIAGSGRKPDPDHLFAHLQGIAGRGEGRILPDSENGKFHLFTTVSAFCDEQECFSLFEGRRRFKLASREELLHAAQLGGAYLAQAVNAGGRFAYTYYPESNRVSETYNIVRHAGTVYAMLELYEASRDRNILNAARKALDYLMLLHARPCSGGPEPAACIVEGEHATLGGNALAALALAKYITVTGDSSNMPMLIALGNRILSSQDEHGKFVIQKQSYFDGMVEDYESEYYPGEALFALTRIYAVDPRPLWLDGAEKGAHYLIGQSKWPLSWKTSHDHWFVYALNELQRLRPDAVYIAHALLIADAIMASQNKDPGDPDRLGGYFDRPRSAPAATRTEGLCAAYLLARDFERPLEAGKILEAIKRGADFLLQLQYRPESSMYFEVPRRTLGGFRNSLTDTAVRIDIVQHNLSALLGLYRILSAERPE